MLSICPYFHIHQPYRIKRYRVFDIGKDDQYFNDRGQSDLNNRKIIEKVAEKSYRPTIKVLQELLDTYPEFHFSLSFSGTVLDQFEAWAPDVLQGFQKLVKSGRVEILADTYYHSLSFFYSVPEFERQVLQHKARIKELFGVTPKVFRNTELSYRNDLAKWCEDHGYIGIMAEGWEKYLGWRSPNFLYTPKGCSKIKVLLKNYKLSDDVAFRFSNKAWESWPLSAETYRDWIFAHHGDGETINLFMDFETFGEHQWEDTGIFNFLRKLPELLLEHPDLTFKTASETVLTLDSKGEYDVPEVLTWADTDRDLTAWNGNDIQKDALSKIYALENDVLATKDAALVEMWQKLQTSDHFYYMCTKWSNDGDVHAYFSPYQSPYDAYIAFMNTLSDLQLRVQARLSLENNKNIDDEVEVTLPSSEELVSIAVTKVEAESVTLKITWLTRLKSWWRRLLQGSFINRFFNRKK